MSMVKKMKDLLSNPIRFKEIAFKLGKEFNLLLQQENKLVNLRKQVETSVTMDLCKQASKQALYTEYVKFIDI